MTTEQMIALMRQLTQELAQRPAPPAHETDDEAWADWIQTPEALVEILRDDIDAIAGIPPSQRRQVRLDRLLKRCNNTRSL